MSIQTAGHEPHGSPCSSLGSSLSKKRSREDAGFPEFSTPPPSRRCSREADDRSSRLRGTYYTPPASDSGSPSVKAEGFQGLLPQIETGDDLCIRPRTQAEQESSSPIKLPCLQQFDEGVQALAEIKSSPSSSNLSPQSLPSFKSVFSPELPALQPSTPRENYLAHQSYYPAPSSFQPSALSGYPPTMAHYPSFEPSDLSPEELYPHAQPRVSNKHCNKKYTVEEGDFIIYLWHDKKLKWEQVRDEYARLFGTEPLRTTQGLQAWYYRMNAIIPCWDKDGYLIFDSEDILEPRTRQIKVRDKERSEVNAEPLGLAQRYPERGMAYSWVEAKDKHVMMDWASKRIRQFNERRDRRRQKEERRAVDLQQLEAVRPVYRSRL